MENYQFTKFMKYSRMKGEVMIGGRKVSYIREPLPPKGMKGGIRVGGMPLSSADKRRQQRLLCKRQESRPFIGTAHD